jgi:hypothetical protein
MAGTKRFQEDWTSDINMVIGFKKWQLQILEWPKRLTTTAPFHTPIYRELITLPEEKGKGV